VAGDATTCDCDRVLCFPDQLREYSGTCTATVEGYVACTADPFDLECGIYPGCAGSTECPPGWVCVTAAGTLCCETTGCFPVLDQRLLPG
jgi:hypothetical protein